MRVTPEQFWNAFTLAVRLATPCEYGTRWTKGMYSALHDVQRRLRLWCQCRNHEDRSNGRSGERLNVDFLWFSDTPWLAQPEQEWVAPVVAIEHENQWSPLDRSVDHWKVCQVAVPLRIFIGYTRSADQVTAAAGVLMHREQRWNAVQGGETLIIMGHGRMSYSCFRAWKADQGESNWQEFPADACPH